MSRSRLVPDDPPAIVGEADREYKTRIEAARVTAQWRRPLGPIDTGRKPITESPLFGGDSQKPMFEEEKP